MTNLTSCLRAVWRREQRLHWTAGALAGLRWGVLLLLAAGLTDWLASKWLADIPVAGRMLLLAAVAVLSFGKARQAGWKHRRPFHAARTALRIEEHEGGMESLLVTAVQLEDEPRRHGLSGALCDLTVRSAQERARAIRPREMVRFRPLRRPAAGALLALLLLGLAAATQGPLLRAGLGRFLAPWLAMTYPTRTRLELLSGNAVVQEGAPLRIAARVSGSVPRRARIAIRTGRGRPRLRDLPIADGLCEYRIDTAYRSFSYQLAAGDARGPWQDVQVIPAPEIERADVTLDYPGYTGRATETVAALTLTVPETTRIRWRLSLDRAVGEAALNLAGEEPLPMAVSEDGRTVTIERTAAGSGAYGFTWVEREHGFRFTSPNHHLQVAPDRPPSVELTSPARNLSATLARRLDLAFRGRDDHGVAEAAVLYRVDRTEDVRVVFEPTGPVDGTEQRIDWDYRTALPDLAVGQTVSFAVELADGYPGKDGPHRARSEPRLVRFMTEDAYLEQVEHQKRRLLSQLKNLYREQRDAHEIMLRLDRSDPVFIQTCQLEAVRQDLMRERLKRLAEGMKELTEDVAANHIERPELTASLDQLRIALIAIGDEHLAGAAAALRALAGETATAGFDAAHALAADRVNDAARNLGLLVLDLGFEDAADVMGRELHSAAQTLAALRLRTLVSNEKNEELADAQERLGQWLSRLFAASPRGKESSVEEALVEFTLTRIVKQLVNGGLDARLQQAAALIREGGATDAARLQLEAIAAMLKAEFRLRVGAEREALARARGLFITQRDAQEALRLRIQALPPGDVDTQRSRLAAAQGALQRNLQQLLLPEVPASRMRLLDDAPPPAPPVKDLLDAADRAMTQAAARLAQGDAPAAETAQRAAEAAFESLAAIAAGRIAAITQAVRIERLTYGAGETDERLGRFAERQLGLLERTEDAAAAGATSAPLAAQASNLAEEVDALAIELADRIRKAGTPFEESQTLPIRVNEALQSMRKAASLLRENKPGAAVRHEEAALAALHGSRRILSEHGSNIAAFAGMLSSAKIATMPGPYVTEIEEEQRDLLELTRETPAEALSELAIPQKNLVHAVNAVLAALDPIGHLVESGTVMLFAKEDMNAAGTALATGDRAEALDAQEFIVETLQALRAGIDAVVPRYLYLLEVTEALHEEFPEGVLVREAQRALREKTVEGADATALAEAQDALKARARLLGGRLDEITGFGAVAASAERMAEAGRLLREGALDAARESMLQAEQALQADVQTLLLLMQRLPAVLAAPPPAQPIPEPFVLLTEVLALAARQKDRYRENAAAAPDRSAEFEDALRAFEKACGPFIERAGTHRYPVIESPAADAEPALPPPANLQRNLVAAKDLLAAAAAGAAAGDRATSLAHQKKAAESLRHFITEYAVNFHVVQPGPIPGDPMPMIDFIEGEDLMQLFMPGVVTGVRPPDGRLEWEVLGRRERAALNENFARELPLEFRAILKDYYERLAR